MKLQKTIGNFFRLRFSKNSLEKEKVSPWLILGLFVIFTIFTKPSMPVDDLLRHLKAHLYNYNYSKLFIYSSFFTYNPYYLFDIVAGFFNRALPEGMDYRVIQVIAIFLNGAGVILLTKGMDKNWQCIALCLYLFCIKERLILARPAIFETGLFLIAVALCENKNCSNITHLMLGILMASFYHAFYIYLLPLIIFRRIYLVPLLVGITGWSIYAGSEYLETFTSLSKLSLPVEKSLKATENYSVIWIVVTGIALIPIALKWKENIKRTLCFVYFLLGNQLKFANPLIGLSVSFAKYFNYNNIRFSYLSLALVMTTTILSPVHNVQKFPFKYAFEKDSKIFCDDMTTMFSAVYHSKVPIKISPSAALTTIKPEILRAMVTMKEKGKFDCKLLEKYYFDYVVEHSLKEIPQCLKLKAVWGKYRVWKTEVKNSESNR
ncbi:MAG TPA: hypothetical protein ENF38_01730 [Candidatus Aenigmarchaeota archaeon]|nr:hypothetical protein [Candidatus Aenigmarchaeota archaeon]